MNPAACTTAPPRPASTHAASRRSPSEPGVLRCTTTADLLAALPFLSGLTADDSLFIVVFSGRRAGETLRMDLPPTGDAAAARAFVIALRKLLRTSGAGPRGAAIVIRSAAGFAECGGVPWLELGRRIEQLFSLREWPLRDLAVLAPDGWAGLLGARAGERRTLEEIAASPVARSTAQLECAPRSLGELTGLPAADPSRTAGIAAELHRLDAAAEAPADRSSSSEIADLARIAEACLGRAADPPPDSAAAPDLCAGLVRATESWRGWIVVALTALTRAAFVVDLFTTRHARRLLDEPPVVPPLSMGAVRSDPGRPALHEWLIAVSEERPSEAKLADAAARLTEVIANAPEERRTGMLALLAWLWWFRGLQSVAQHFVELALESDRNCPMARVIGYVNQAPPVWCIELLRAGGR